MEKRNTAKHHIASRSMVICWILIFALYAFTLADQYYNDTHNTISKSIAFGIIIFWPSALIITVKADQPGQFTARMRLNHRCS